MDSTCGTLHGAYQPDGPGNTVVAAHDDQMSQFDSDHDAPSPMSESMVDQAEDSGVEIDGRFHLSGGVRSSVERPHAHPISPVMHILTPSTSATRSISRPTTPASTCTTSERTSEQPASRLTTPASMPNSKRPFSDDNLPDIPVTKNRQMQSKRLSPAPDAHKVSPRAQGLNVHSPLSDLLKSASLEQLTDMCRTQSLELGLRSNIRVTVFPEEIKAFFNCLRPSHMIKTDHIKAILATINWPPNFLVLDPHLMDVNLGDANRLPRNLESWHQQPWTQFNQRYENIVVPYCHKNHWTLLMATVAKTSSTIHHYDSFYQHSSLCAACGYLQLMIDRMHNLHSSTSLEWQSPHIMPRPRQQAPRSNDCGLWVGWNAEMLAQGCDPTESSLPCPKDLRLYYARRTVQQAQAEAPDRRLDAIIKRPKRGLVLMPSIPFTADLDDEEETVAVSVSAWNQIQDGMHPNNQWKKDYLNVMERKNTISQQSLGSSRALRLMELVAGLGHPQYFIQLKKIVAELRELKRHIQRVRPANRQSRTSIFYYRMGLEGERQGLLSSLMLRLVHSYYAGQVATDTYLMRHQGPLSQRSKESGEKGQALTRATSAIAQSTLAAEYPLADHTKPDGQAHLQSIIQKLNSWRRKGGIWMMLEERFQTQLLLILAPLSVQLIPRSRGVLLSDYERLPVGERAVFFEMLECLRPRLRCHAEGLSRLFEVIQDPTCIPDDKKFHLELLSDGEILRQELDSNISISAFTWHTSSDATVQTIPSSLSV